MKLLKLLFVSLLILNVGCDKKSVKLPVLNVKGIQDTIYDNSQIWIFFQLKNKDTITKLNRNNTISTTNWIFNIDKRLSLQQVVPKLKKMIEKREKPSLHPKDINDSNYFSYVDTVSNALSLIPFEVIHYKMYTPLDKTSLNKNDSLSKHLFINYLSNGISVNDSLISISQINDYITNKRDTEKLKLHLSFDKNLTYQNYIHLKALLQNINNDSIQIDTNEYIN